MMRGTLKEPLQRVQKTGLRNDSYNAATNFSNIRHRFSNNKTIEAETLTGITTVGRKRNRQQGKRK